MKGIHDFYKMNGNLGPHTVIQEVTGLIKEVSISRKSPKREAIKS